MTNWKARLEALERSRSAGKGPLTLFYSYGEPVPEPPPGYGPITYVQEVVVERDEATGELVTPDPWGGPPLRFRDDSELPDRDPRNKP
jgi:hypothetical protein